MSYPRNGDRIVTTDYVMLAKQWQLVTLSYSMQDCLLCTRRH